MNFSSSRKTLRSQPSFELIVKFTRTRELATVFKQPAFTLIEMLIVVVVIGMLLALTAPSLLGLMTSSRVSDAGETIVGTLSEAQSRANSISRPVEIRLYRVKSDLDTVGGGAKSHFRGVLLLEYYQEGELDPRFSNQSSASTMLKNPLAVIRQSMYSMPEGMAMSENSSLSTLVTELPEPNQGAGKAVETVLRTSTGTFIPYTPPSTEYKSFLMYPETTNLDNTLKWFVTLVPTKDVDKQPNELKNYFTVQIDPVTARISSYRP